MLNTSMDYNEILEVITNPKNSIAEEESIKSAIDGIGGGSAGDDTQKESGGEDEEGETGEDSDKKDGEGKKEKEGT